MNYDETQQILKVMRTNYPHSFKDMTKSETFDFLGLWAEAFADDPVELVVSAVKSIIYGDSREFAPNIGQVKQKMSELSKPRGMTEQEAFEMIRKACSNAIYNANEEFDKLPFDLQRIAGSPQQLREWATVDSSTFNTVVASNIQRSYKAIAKQEKDYRMLPSDVRKMIENTRKIGVD